MLMSIMCSCQFYSTQLKYHAFQLDFMTQFLTNSIINESMFRGLLDFLFIFFFLFKSGERKRRNYNMSNKNKENVRFTTPIQQSLTGAHSHVRGCCTVVVLVLYKNQIPKNKGK